MVFRVKISIAICFIILCTFSLKLYYKKKHLDYFYNSFWEHIHSSYNLGESAILDTNSVLLFITKDGDVGYFCFDAFTNKTAKYKYSIIDRKTPIEMSGYLKPDKHNCGYTFVLHDKVEERNASFFWHPPNELFFGVDMAFSAITNKSFKDTFSVDMTNNIPWIKVEALGL